MADRCYICGTPLKETSWGRKFCPNCGIISDGEDEIEDPNEKRNYIG